MTKRRADNTLALTPLASDFGTTISLAPWSSRWALTEDEKRLNEEARMQQLAIEAIAAKARFGASKVGEIHQHASLTFDETVGFVMEVKDRPGRSQQHQAYIDEFTERQVQLLAQHSLGVVDVGATSIGLEVHRDVYSPPGSRRRAGFLQRLFGGRE